MRNFNRKSNIVTLGVALLLTPLIAACSSPQYVDNNGKQYYDANDVATDTMPSGAYTRGGQYVDNPEEATNTRDNRGDHPFGYGHDAGDDYHQAPPGTVIVHQSTPSTVIYPSYPPGSVLNSDGSVSFPDGRTIYPHSTTTTTTTTTVLQPKQ